MRKNNDIGAQLVCCILVWSSPPTVNHSAPLKGGEREGEGSGPAVVSEDTGAEESDWRWGSSYSLILYPARQASWGAASPPFALVLVVYSHAVRVLKCLTV